VTKKERLRGDKKGKARGDNRELAQIFKTALSPFS